VWMQSTDREARRLLEHQAVGHAPRPPRLTVRGPHRADVLGQLSVPRLHVSVMVLEGDDAGILRVGAGHVPWTALPGNGGDFAVAAHRDTFFRPLRFIRRDDVIVWKSAHETLRYTVTGTERVAPSDIDALSAAPGRDLTLVTCYPFYFVGHAPRRFIVHAKRI